MQHQHLTIQRNCFLGHGAAQQLPSPSAKITAINTHAATAATAVAISTVNTSGVLGERVRVTENGLLGIGTVTPDKTIGIGDGTDEFAISVQSDRLAFWNDASTPAVIGTLDSVGVLRLRNDIVIDSTNNVRIITGTATPEGAVIAGVGSTFHRRNGSSGTTLYIKESGTGNTGWVAISSAADNLGNHTATTNLNMATNHILAVGRIEADSNRITNPSFFDAATWDFQDYTTTTTLNRKMAHYWDGTSDDTLTTNTALPDKTLFFCFF